MTTDSAQPSHAQPAMGTSADRPLAPETLVVDLGRPERAHDAPLNPPVVFTSTFIGTEDITADDYGYARFGNPTWDPFESALATLEGAKLPGLVFASGLAAISAALETVAPGGTVIMPEHCYMGALSGAGATAATGRFDLVTVDIADTEAVLAAVRTATAAHATATPGADSQTGGAQDAAGTERAVLLWIESPTNPMLEVADMPALITGAHAAGAYVCVDNTFATPLVQKPLEMGADLVVHSATKYIAGHSDVVLGAVLTSREDLREAVLTRRSIHGGIAGPMEVWLGLRGLRTMALRVERSMSNAQLLAERLADLAEAVPGMSVRYPGLPTDPGHARAAAQMSGGFGSIICVDMGSAEAAVRVAEAVRLFTPATSLGGVESLIERRRRHAAEPESVPAGLLRLSIGIEHVEDLWDDLRSAIQD